MLLHTFTFVHPYGGVTIMNAKNHPRKIVVNHLYLVAVITYLIFMNKIKLTSTMNCYIGKAFIPRSILEAKGDIDYMVNEFTSSPDRSQSPFP